MINVVQRALWTLLGWFRRSDRLWSLIDHTGIVVFTGPNGSGKSLAAVHSALSTLEGVPWSCDVLAHHHNHDLSEHVAACTEGCDRNTQRPIALCVEGDRVAECTHGVRLVYSTVPLLDGAGEPHDLYRPLVDFRQLVTIEHADVLFDEVAGIADSADSSSIPVQVTNWLHQLRKRDVRLRVTTPAYARCAKPIRQVAQCVVDSRSFLSEARSDGRLWRPRKAMIFRAFDAFDFEDYTSSVAKGDRVKPLAGAAFWRPGSEASKRYDTLGAVQALGHVTEGGMCAVCGGSRPRPKCACDHSVDDVPADQLVVEENVSAGGARIRRARRLETPPVPLLEVEAVEVESPIERVSPRRPRHGVPGPILDLAPGPGRPIASGAEQRGRA